MILIADSGSTKTDWRLVDNNGNTKSFETIGFNPYFITSASILNELTSSKLVDINNNVAQVFFYGAGCSTEQNCKVIFNPLSTFFKNAKVEVDHDMLAAARATCVKEEGMVGILGSGSNSCLYNGISIVENVEALGFILGDYGSGADIGKTFIKAYLGKEIPNEVEAAFNKQYKLNSTDVLDAVYKQTLPNRFLAGFSLFVFQHINQPFIQEMVESRFELFFEKNICKYSNYKSNTLHLVGSIAFVYQAIYKNISKKYEVQIGKIIKQPIDELVKYHV